MSRGVRVLLGAQFLTAFADNAILFTAIAMLIEAPRGAWYVPALQSCFPRRVRRCSRRGWAVRRRALEAARAAARQRAQSRRRGAHVRRPRADRGLRARRRRRGRLRAREVRHPARARRHGSLVRANGWIEGSTIVAIVIGTVVGARVADRSVPLALTRRHGVLRRVRAPRRSRCRGWRRCNAMPRPGSRLFVARMRTLFEGAPARFAMLGNSLFWASAAVLRLLLVAWAPVVLATQSASDVADLTLFLALGIVAGALIVPRLIPLAHLRRARLAAYAMGVCDPAVQPDERRWPARAVLVAIGVCGGMFLVPINAALQDIGHRTVGSGRAVALQSFFENSAMLTGVGLYTASVGLGGAARRFDRRRRRARADRDDARLVAPAARSRARRELRRRRRLSAGRTPRF